VVGLFSNSWSEYEDELASKREALLEERAEQALLGVPTAHSNQGLATRAGSFFGKIVSSGRAAIGVGSARSETSVHSIHGGEAASPQQGVEMTTLHEGGRGGGLPLSPPPASPARGVPALPLDGDGVISPQQNAASAQRRRGSVAQWQALQQNLTGVGPVARAPRRASAASSRGGGGTATGAIPFVSARETRLEMLTTAQMIAARAAAEGESDSENEGVVRGGVDTSRTALDEMADLTIDEDKTCKQRCTGRCTSVPACQPCCSCLRFCRPHLKPFVRHAWFEYGVMFLIILNTVVMVLDSPTADVEQSRVLQSLEIVFTAIFASEMAIKLIVNGWGYWDHTLNILDAVIVTLSMFALPFNILALVADAADSDLLDIVRAVLIFRVLRLVRLMLRIPGMQELIRTAFKSTHALANLVGLTVFMTCVYALLGMQLFGGRYPENDALADDRLRFDTFFQSSVTLFVLLTYDGWSSVTQNTWVSSASWAAMPYVLFWLFFGLVLTNWYVAVILEGFEQAEEERFANHMTRFRSLTRFQGEVKLQVLRRRAQVLEGQLAAMGLSVHRLGATTLAARALRRRARDVAPLWLASVQARTQSVPTALAATVEQCLSDDAVAVYRLPVAVRQAAMPSMLQALALALYHPAPAGGVGNAGAAAATSARGSWTKRGSSNSSSDSSDDSAPGLGVGVSQGGAPAARRASALQMCPLTPADVQALHGALLSVLAAVRRAGHAPGSEHPLTRISVSQEDGAAAYKVQQEVLLLHAAALSHSVFGTCATSATKAKILLLHRSARLQALKVELSVDEVAVLDEIQAAGGDTEEAGIHRFAHLSEGETDDSTYNSDSSEYMFFDEEEHSSGGGSGGDSEPEHASAGVDMATLASEAALTEADHATAVMTAVATGGAGSSVDDVLPAPSAAVSTGRDEVAVAVRRRPGSAGVKAQVLAARLTALDTGRGADEAAATATAAAASPPPGGGGAWAKTAPNSTKAAASGTLLRAPNSTRNKGVGVGRTLRKRTSQETPSSAAGGRFFVSNAHTERSGRSHRTSKQENGSVPAGSASEMKDRRLKRHFRASVAMARLQAKLDHEEEKRSNAAAESARPVGSERTTLPPISAIGKLKRASLALMARGAPLENQRPSVAADGGAGGVQTPPPPKRPSPPPRSAPGPLSGRGGVAASPAAPVHMLGHSAQPGSVSDLALHHLGTIDSQRHLEGAIEGGAAGAGEASPSTVLTRGGNVTPSATHDDSDSDHSEFDPFSPNPQAIAAAADTAMQLAGMSWLSDSSAERAAAGAAATVVHASGPVSAAAVLSLPPRAPPKSRAQSRLEDEAAVATTGRADGGAIAETFPPLPSDPREMLPVVQAFMVFHVEKEEHDIAARAAAQAAALADLARPSAAVSVPVAGVRPHRRSTIPDSLDIAPALSTKTIDDTNQQQNGDDCLAPSAIRSATGESAGSAASGGWLDEISGALQRSASHIRLTTALGLGGHVFGGGPKVVSAMHEEPHPTVPPPARLAAMGAEDTGPVTVHRTAMGPVVRHHPAQGDVSDEEEGGGGGPPATHRSALLDMITTKRAAGEAVLRTGMCDAWPCNVCCFHVSCYFLQKLLSMPVWAHCGVPDGTSAVLWCMLLFTTLCSKSL